MGQKGKVIKPRSWNFPNASHTNPVSNAQPKKDKIKTIALVGYTNTGKSTLLSRLTGAETYIKNELSDKSIEKIIIITERIYIIFFITIPLII